MLWTDCWYLLNTVQSLCQCLTCAWFHFAEQRADVWFCFSIIVVTYCSGLQHIAKEIHILKILKFLSTSQKQALLTGLHPVCLQRCGCIVV